MQKVAWFFQAFLSLFLDIFRLVENSQKLSDRASSFRGNIFLLVTHCEIFVCILSFNHEKAKTQSSTHKLKSILRISSEFSLYTPYFIPDRRQRDNVCVRDFSFIGFFCKLIGILVIMRENGL